MTLLYVVICLTLAVLVAVVRLSRDTKGLSRFPLPSIFARTPLWAVYHNWKGRRYIAVDEAHRRLGPIIQIGPENLSFASPGAYKDIYGHGSSILKDVFYDNLAGSTPSIADTTSRSVHSAKRKNVSSIFSAKHVTAMEPKVKDTVRKLLRAIRCKSEGRMVSAGDQYHPIRTGEFDLRPWMNMFSFDAFSAMMWSSSYEFLDRGNDRCPAIDKNGAVTMVNAMNSFQTGVHFNTICAQFSPLVYRLSRWISQPTSQRQAADRFTGMARYQTVKRLEAKPEGPDFFTHLPYEDSEKARPVMGLSELVAECATFLNAGNDTTQISLTNTMFELASHPSRQKHLREELVKNLPRDSTPIASYQELSQIPYLRACIDETFRLLPPVRFGLPRRTTTDGATIAGHFIPPGVTVSSSVYTLHRDSTLFHEPLEWKPERWLAETPGISDFERQNLKDYVLPFTLGGRACIGRNLAYMELSICLAAMVMAFDWIITPEMEQNYRHYERFNSSPLELMILATAIQ